MTLEFHSTVSDTEEVMSARLHGECPLCGVPGSSLLPLLRLREDGETVFDGCAGCLQGRVGGIPEGRALVRAVLLVARCHLGQDMETA